MPSNRPNSSNSSEGSGNTRLPPKKQISPSKHWRFTFNNYTEDDIKQLIDDSSNSSNIYVFQEEIAPKTGTPHLQGHMSFSEKIRPKTSFSTKISWHKSTKVKQSIAYASDPAKRKPNGRIWNKGIKIKKPLRLITEEQLYYWEKDIVSFCQEEADDRTIHWYWHELGDMGKTSFAKYLVSKHDAIVLGGKAHDIRHGLCDYYKNHNETYPDIVILNFTRTLEGYISWTGIENCKDALFYSGKFEGGMVCANSPHVICFANFKPKTDDSNISKERWHIHHITPPAKKPLRKKRRFSINKIPNLIQNIIKTI